MSRLSAVLVAVVLALASADAGAKPITLAEALKLAEHSPGLGVAAATVDETRGNLEQASTYRYNPTLGGSVGRARSNGSTFYDYEIGVGQTIELGGKRGARRGVARAERDVASERFAGMRVAQLAEVRRAFDAAIVAEARVQVTAEAETWARAFREAAAERMRLGAATQTEVNVAVANLGRAIATKKAAERDLLLARQALGEVLGIIGTDLEPRGSMPAFAHAPIGEDRLVADALATRRDLVAATRTRDARAAAVDLADAAAIPDPELSVSYERSALEDSHAVVIGLRVALPIFDRNQGERRAARAGVKRATIEAGAARIAVERDVRTAARRYLAATDAVAAFDEQVVGKLGENLELARETLAAGKLGLLEVNAVRRDLVESQLSYLDAIAEAVEARAALETSLGRQVSP